MRKYFIVLSLVFVIVLLLSAKEVNFEYSKIFFPSNNKSGKVEGNKTMEETQLPEKLSETQFQNLTNESKPSEGGGETPSITPSFSANISEVLTLKIVGICSGIPVEGVSATIEGGGTFCFNEESPYFIIFEQNSTHIISYFYNQTDLSETLNKTESTLVYYLYAEDVHTIANKIDNIRIFSNVSCFKIGNYTLHTVRENVNGELKVTKMIVIFPLYMEDCSPLHKWEKLNFILSAEGRDYYLGSMFVKIKEKQS